MQGLGWLCVILGAIGAVLPLLPTTPFLILALSLFAKSSPRFHQMLLDNPWFGPSLQQWEESKTISAKAKKRAIILVICTFSISIFMVRHTWQLQVMLLLICSILLFFMSRLTVRELTTQNDLNNNNHNSN